MPHAQYDEPQDLEEVEAFLAEDLPRIRRIMDLWKEATGGGHQSQEGGRPRQGEEAPQPGGQAAPPAGPGRQPGSPPRARPGR